MGFKVNWSDYPATAARVDEKKLSGEAGQYLAPHSSGESSGNSQARTEEGEE